MPPDTRPPPELRLAELVATLSLAADIGVGQPYEHAQRAAIGAVLLGESLGLGENDLKDTFYITLLRFIGCVGDDDMGARLLGDDVGEQWDPWGGKIAPGDSLDAGVADSGPEGGTGAGGGRDSEPSQGAGGNSSVLPSVDGGQADAAAVVEGEGSNAGSAAASEGCACQLLRTGPRRKRAPWALLMVGDALYFRRRRRAVFTTARQGFGQLMFVHRRDSAAFADATRALEIGARRARFGRQDEIEFCLLPR